MIDPTEVSSITAEAFQLALERAAREAVISVPSVKLTGPQLKQLLEALPASENEEIGVRDLRSAGFLGTVFTGTADFSLIKFLGPADFSDACFIAGAAFARCRFESTATLARATFGGEAAFTRATFAARTDLEGTTFAEGAGFVNAGFQQGASFDNATFKRGADFMWTTFGADVSFSPATFDGYACFREMRFEGAVTFHGATFAGTADFNTCHFGASADFTGARVHQDLDLVEATAQGSVLLTDVRFAAARDLGPLTVEGELCLDRAVFAESVRLQVTAARVRCTRTTFRGGADLLLGGATVVLDGADFAAESLISPPAQGVFHSSAQPRVVSMRGAKVARLTMSGVDLRACRFVGAHGLHGLHLEDVTFGQSPVGYRLRRWPPHWTPRAVLAEEHHWRADRQPCTGWYDESHGLPEWLDEETTAPRAEQIAGIYRALRRSREDGRDTPGAGDFYYGEMEMRREQAATRLHQRAERALLSAYWITAGYGLRASRAALSLVVTIALLAGVLALCGFCPERSYGSALLFATESSISLLRAPDAPLTPTGEVTTIVLRLVGPLFFGLAVLSVRGRVKR